MEQSRLDKLLTLLEAKNSTVRQQAAQQIGDVARFHLSQLNSLLSHLRRYIKSPSSWDARVAAALALKEICRNILASSDDQSGSIGHYGEMVSKKAINFDLQALLASEFRLLGSEGKEFDIGMIDSKSASGNESASDRQAQRLRVAQQLGFFQPQANDVAEIVTDEDLYYGGFQGSSTRLPVDQAVDDPTPPKLFKFEPNEAIMPNVNVESEPKVILANFVRSLCFDLYDPNWTCRHGAALSLKEAVSAPQFSALFFPPSSRPTEAAAMIPLSATDILRHVFNVLAVDRFNDFVGEHVVAPVRETCSQLVAAILLSFRQSKVKLSEEQSTAIESAAISLIKNVLDICGAFLSLSGDPKQWECRHAGLLTVKYVIGAMQSRALLSMTKYDFNDQLCMIFDAIVNALDDLNDDVVIAAAQALLPLVDTQKTVSPAKVQGAIDRCWQLLHKHVGIPAIDLQQPSSEQSASIVYDFRLINDSGSCYDDSAADGLFQLLESSPTPLSIDDGRLFLLLTFFSHNQYQTRQRLASVLMQSAKHRSLILTDPAWCRLVVRVLFQCLVDEHYETAERLATELWPSLIDLQSPEALWLLCRPILGQWLACIMVSEQTPLNAIGGEVSQAVFGTKENVYLGGKDISTHSDLERDRIVLAARLRGARLLAVICNKIILAEADQTSDARHSLTQLVALHLNTNSAYQRAAVCMFLCEWAKLLDGSQSSGTHPFFEDMKKLLENLLSLSATAPVAPTVYDEVIFNGSEIHAACRDFLSIANVGGADLQSISPAAIVLNAREAQEICGRALHVGIERRASAVTAGELQHRFEQLKELIKRNSTHMDRINIRVSAWLACAYVRVGGVPTKFNPIVQPLMNCLKNEPNQLLVEETAECLALLLEVAPACPSSKIVKNLTVIHSSDPKMTPTVDPSKPEESRLLSWESKSASTAAVEQNGDAALMAKNAGAALKGIVKHFGEKLVQSFPSFYETLTKPLAAPLSGESTDQALVNAMQIVETVYSSLPQAIRVQVREIQIPALCGNLQHESSVVRHMSCRCLVAMAEFDLTPTLNAALPPCLQLLSKTSMAENGAAKSQSHCGELGGTEMIYALVEKLSASLIGVIPLLAVPILAGMSSSEAIIRPVASYTFGQLVKLMPLETDDRALPGLSAELTSLRRKRLEFLHLLSRPDELGRQITDGDEKRKQILDSIRVNAELRSYQRDGIVWLRFLAEYGLHGILCDDMGLGKTLQTLTAVASGLVGEEGKTKRASLIVCPKTLTSHWMNEIRKFFGNATHSDDAVLRPTCLIDRSMPIDFSSFNVVVTSYDLFRKESAIGSMDAVLSYRWNYCILDEGHVIRNPKTRLFRALTQLKSDHRLILSGTPVQNSVLELWALFEFLMPGYLGSQSQFQARFGKPILLSRDAKASSAEAESGQAALENLHKLVLPFILRRRKCDVLADLPPKIIQDYPCPLSSLQSRLYEDFSRAIKDKFGDAASGNAAGKRATGAFQILLYLRKLCDHPCLVVDEKHPNFGQVNSQVAGGEFGTDCRDLDDFRLSGKMVALKQLLSECGIGRQGEAEEEEEVQAVSPHRALIFCQFKAVIALIARYFDAGVFGHSIGYRRLDGDVPPAQRQAIVDQFNEDPSIDVLLLSTQIGGLGLNLTGADVVIFVDHDWNPANDLQAMDRAHRIGQKRTVNVYRLITSGTLEEKMMRLQQFKTRTADALIGEENRSLMSMATDQLLDLLTLDSGAGAGGGSGDGDAATGRHKKTSRAGGKKASEGKGAESASGYAAIDLPSLWDQSQYDEAFDYNAFISALPS